MPKVIRLAVNVACNLTPDQDGIAEIILRADHTPAHPPPSVPTRQSARKKNAPVNPCFVPTQADSRQSLQTQLAADTGVTDGRTSLIASVNKCSTSAPRSQEDQRSNQTQETKINVDSESIYNLKQNSNKENTKVACRSLKSKEDRKIAPRKDGTKSVLVYFVQLEDGLTYKCVWCSKTVKASALSYYNLKVHRNGQNFKGTIRAACPNQSKSIAAGSKLPPTAAETAQDDSESKTKPGNTIAAYVTKGRFSNNTFNKLMVFWLILHSLPWT
ncbi:hypothetical protein PCANC_03365 [Puccinia coronata f. sp. avenae]|uniref:Uncharacterized protein n=1 Tax=Puccinia coronata f. sp. avenae TaxID=200324 RepID=A0A2N5T8T8_9BASI|nr:hypothetical protein PCANC_03365 [Puccinia coronata f. sp. avenae]